MNPRARIIALVAAWLVLALAVPFAIHAIAPFAALEVSIIAGVAVGLAIVIAARITKDKRAFDTTSIFDVRAAIGSLAIVVGGAGVLAFLLFDHWHEDLWVHNGLPDDVTVSVDGHLLGTVIAGADHKYETVPVNAEQITAAATTGKPLDTAPVDSTGSGRFVFDVGGTACWEIRTITYGPSFGFGGHDAPVAHIEVGDAHLFRAKSDFLGDAPSSASSESSSVTHTLLEVADCHGKRH